MLLRLSIRRFATKAGTIFQRGRELDKSYKILGLERDCSKQELKEKYLNLVKKYHPDSASAESDVSQFQYIREAYKFIVKNDYTELEQSELESILEERTINHTIPQHRQYLEYGGIGSGTPAQRQKQYSKYRVRQATENVREFLVEKILSAPTDSSLPATQDESKFVKKTKTTNAIERLVEDLIQESMRKGEFDNLSGKGKPLNPGQDYNPYLDATTHKLNQILIQQGYSPEWVRLEKEIRDEIRKLRANLNRRRLKLPEDVSAWTEEERRRWAEISSNLDQEILSINKQMDRFNLVVPSLSKQMFHLTAVREAKKALESEFVGTPSEEQSSPEPKRQVSGILRSLIDSVQAK